MIKEKIIRKLEDFITEAENFLIQVKFDHGSEDAVKFHTFRTSVLSFLEFTLGRENLYFNDFRNSVRYYKLYNITYAISLLGKIKNDVKDGWLTDIKSLISAEIYSDFIEMAEDLLNQGYKDSAAVLIGGVLEENLRQLCLSNNIPIMKKEVVSGKLKPLKADSMNTELYKAGIYNTLVQKSIVTQLDLRNKAAHGKYTEYDKDQVQLMLSSIVDFTSKYN